MKTSECCYNCAIEKRLVLMDLLHRSSDLCSRSSRDTLLPLMGTIPRGRLTVLWRPDFEKEDALTSLGRRSDHLFETTLSINI